MTRRLAGKRVLIVEDEQLFADYLAEAEGAEVIEPVASVNAALDAITNTLLDGVTLDLKLKGETILPVADILAARNIPFIFLTGYGAADVPARHANVTRVEEPVAPSMVCPALEAAMSTARKE
jgi:CheY-like chemotaxis protein